MNGGPKFLNHFFDRNDLFPSNVAASLGNHLVLDVNSSGFLRSSNSRTVRKTFDRISVPIIRVRDHRDVGSPRYTPDIIYDLSQTHQAEIGLSR